MYYLVHLPTQHRPYITTLPYIALDFRKWGYRVDTYANDSKYIAEIRSREKAIKWKVELSEMWAREIVTRMRQDRERGNSDDGAYPEIRGLSTEERRYERASRIVQHFIDALAAFDTPSIRYRTSSSLDPRPLPPSPLGLVSKYMRRLHTVRYTFNATLPDWTNPNTLIADEIAMEFRIPELESLSIEQCTQAVAKAVAKNAGHMGRVERSTETGYTKVVLLVDVGDVVLGQDEETIDPVPVYERGEGPPPYVAASAG